MFQMSCKLRIIWTLNQGGAESHLPQSCHNATNLRQVYSELHMESQEISMVSDNVNTKLILFCEKQFSLIIMSEITLFIFIY